MTVLAEAFRAAGYQPSGERLREIAMQALLEHPTNPYTRRAAIMLAIGEDASLLLLLFDRYVTDATDRLIAAVRNDMILDRRTGRPGCEAHTDPARAAADSGGRDQSETRTIAAPAARTDIGDRAGHAARGGVVPAASTDARDHPVSETRASTEPGAGAQAIAAVMRLSLLDTFRVNGQALGDVTPAEARLWADARGRQARRDARFVELICAGLPDGHPIRRFRRDDEAEAAWREALQEAAA